MNISHTGVKGMKWYERYHQSYKTAPTRSGKMGSEHGEAAKQASRLAKQEEKAEKWRQREIKALDKRYAKYEKNAEIEAALAGANWLQNPNDKTFKRAVRATQTHNIATLMRKRAVQSVKRMSLSDIKKEQLARGKDILESIGLGSLLVGAGIVVAPTNPGLAAAGSSLGLSYIPTNIHVSKNWRRDARVNAEYEKRRR